MKPSRAISEGSNDRSLITLALIVGVAGLVVALYQQSFSAMAELWQHSDYRYCVLVFPICGYLLWRSRAALVDVDPRPSAWGIGLLAALVLGWALSRAVGTQVVEQLSAVLLIPAAVVTFLGATTARRVLFPLAFLVAAVPLGEALVPSLMRTTANISTALLRGVGVPVLREGQFLTLPGGRFEVADVCAGLHTLISGTILALLFAYLTYRSNLKRVLFVAVSAAVLVAVNGVRAFIVMLVASATEMRVFAGRDHVLFGWLFFGAIVFALFSVGQHFADAPESRGAADTTVAGGTPRKTLLPLVVVLVFVMLATTARQFQRDFSDWVMLAAAALLLAWVLRGRFQRSGATPSSGLEVRPFGTWRAVVVVFTACGVLGVGPLLERRSAGAAVETHEVRALPPLALCGKPVAWSPHWQPEFGSSSVVISGTYGCTEPVSVFMAGYSENVQGTELVSDLNRVIPDEWSDFSTTSKETFDNGIGQVVDVNEVQVRREEGESLIWYWYSIGDRTATTAVGVKLLQVLELITAGRSDGEVYLLETPLTPALESDRERLGAVARQLAVDGSTRSTLTVRRDQL